MDGSTFWMYQQDEVRKPLQKSDKLRSLFFKGQGVYLPTEKKYGTVHKITENEVWVSWWHKGGLHVSPFNFNEVEIALADREGKNV